LFDFIQLILGSRALQHLLLDVGYAYPGDPPTAGEKVPAPVIVICLSLYSVIQKDGFNFVHLFFLNYT
jgi:hypothetical protein